MGRIVTLCVLALTLGACGSGPKKCLYDTGCYPADHCVAGVCVAREGAGGGSGGAGGAGGSGGTGGGGAGGSGGGGSAACVGGCAAWEECVGTACLGRYGALQWAAPLEGTRLNAADGGLALAAQLNLAAGRAPAFPASLAVALRGPSGLLTVGNVDHTTNGAYAGVLPISSGSTDGVYVLGLEGYAGLDAGPRSVTLDRTAPIFDIGVEPVPVRANDGGLTTRDPVLGPVDAFRRDESLDVAISYSATDIPDGGIQWQVFGLFADGGAGLAPASSVTQVGSGCRATCDAGLCQCFRIELSGPPLEAARGTVSIRVRMVDEAGNASGPYLAAAPQVTRWKWSRAVASAGTSPALGTGGTLYFGAGNNVMSLSRDGVSGWTMAAGGSMSVPVAVGVADAGLELVFYVTNSLYSGALEANSGVGGNCMHGVLGTEATTPTLLWTTTSGGVTALTLATLRDDATQPSLTSVRVSSASPCVASTLGGMTPAPGTVTTDGTRLVGTAANGRLWSATFDGTDWQAGAATNTGAANLKSLALDAPSGLAVASGDHVTRATAPLNGVFTPLLQGAMFGPSIASAPGVWWAGSSVDGGTLHRFGPGTTAATASLRGALSTAPMAGSGGVVYLVTDNGDVEARLESDLSLLWRWPLGDAVLVSPSLDVTRDGIGGKLCGKPGVLYVLSNAGTLYALIADSPGLERNAPWPRLQHDPRNSGNSGWSLTEFSCP